MVSDSRGYRVPLLLTTLGAKEIKIIMTNTRVDGFSISVVAVAFRLYCAYYITISSVILPSDCKYYRHLKILVLDSYPCYRRYLRKCYIYKKQRLNGTISLAVKAIASLQTPRRTEVLRVRVPHRASICVIYK